MTENKYSLILSSNNLIKISIISALFFLVRWATSFYFYNEDLIIKILFESESDGGFYYTIINFLSNGDLTNSLNPLIEKVNPIAVPFGSLIIHTTFYKIFGFYGLILVDFFGIFLFLLIFFKIFSFFNNNQNALFYALLLFGMPLLINYFFANYNEIPFIQFKNFFTLRVHRPFPSNLYFFSFILLTIYMCQTNFFEKKYFFLTGLLMGLSLSSFYYYFVTEFLIFFFCIIFLFKKKTINILLKNYFSVIILIITFCLISSPFIMNMFIAEKDLLITGGVFELTSEKRFILLKYYFAKFFDLKFLSLNFIIFLTIYLVNKYKVNYHKIINIFFLIYIGSLAAPYLTLLFSQKISFMYHFNNNIVVYGFLFLFISAIIIFHSKINIKLNPLYLLFFLIFINFSLILDNKKELNIKRYELNEIVKIINSKNLKIDKASLLTFDPHVMIWSMLSNKVEYLNITMAGITGKSHELIENDLINAFKFLKLNSQDFLNFLDNKKKGNKISNSYAGLFFRHKYTANSLVRYNDSKNFDPKIKNLILNSSPLYVQQIAIPIEEFSRLENKFDQHKMNNFIKPKMIVFNKKFPLIDKIEINKDNYCDVFEGKKYMLFLHNSNNMNCDEFKSILLIN